VSWRTADQDDFTALREFLMDEEWRCVGFSSRLRERFTSRWTNTEFYALLIDENRKRGAPTVRQAVMLGQDGCVIPALDSARSFDIGRDGRLGLLFRRYRGRLHSIMGDGESVRKLEAFLGEPPFASVDYHLMIRDFARHPPEYPPLRPDLDIRTATPEDTARLYPLQKSYELEEVFLDSSRFDERRCRALLRKNLKKQLVVLAEKSGVPVAKAGTNARGYGVDQLGGIYTRRELRNRGIAAYLLEILLDMIKHTKKGACLFVKKDNPAAARLYAKLEFTVWDSFRISYYSRP
jgi:GNAT superfamily N-acetyltransferase